MMETDACIEPTPMTANSSDAPLESDSPTETKDIAPTRVIGVAQIKPEFIDHDYKPRLELSYVAESVKSVLTDEPTDTPNNASEEPPAKKVKLKGKNVRKMRERWREVDSTKLCPTIVLEKKCVYGEKCRFSHDVDTYLQNKMTDLEGECTVYRTLGRCTYGLTCRFSRDHVTDDLRNVVDERLMSESARSPITLNNLSKSLTTILRQRRISFPKADAYLKSVGVKPYFKMQGPECSRAMNVNSTASSDIGSTLAGENCYDVTAEMSDVTLTVDRQCDVDPAGECLNDVDAAGECLNDVESIPECLNDVKPSGDLVAEPKNTANCRGDVSSPLDTLNDVTPVANIRESVDTDCRTDNVRLRPQEKKLIDFRDKLYLAPLTTVGNLPFRRICKRFGADITCGEMAMSTNILQGKHSEWALLKRHSSEDVFGVQLCGGHADSMTRCAELISNTCDVDFIDVNIGCPIDLVFKKGEGSALMNRWGRLEHIVRGMTSVCDLPITVKMRTGVYEEQNTAHKLIPNVRDWGATIVTLHGRSREQRYTKSANWAYIGECAQVAQPMPLFGNGDILSYEDYEAYRASAPVAGTMIARGALIKPWIFTEIKERRHWDISSSERLDMLKDFVHSGLLHWGSDAQGVETTRRFLLEWLSFLHRYIPVGLLEFVPQKINERPPAYVGRDDLETLMASANCADWIKISEMVLGPVPPGFTFLPKHKANAYK